MRMRRRIANKLGSAGGASVATLYFTKKRPQRLSIGLARYGLQKPLYHLAKQNLDDGKPRGEPLGECF
jgi:hypothetical protein